MASDITEGGEWVTTKLRRSVSERARLVAAVRGCSVAELVSEAVRGVVDGPYEELMAAIPAKLRGTPVASNAVAAESRAEAPTPAPGPVVAAPSPARRGGRLPAEEVRSRNTEIYRLRAEKLSMKAIAERVGCSIGTVQNILKRPSTARSNSEGQGGEAEE